MAGPLIDRMRSAVAANPAAPAFIFQDKVVTHGQFLALVRETARLFHERGIRPGDAVALSMGRWPMHCVAMLALARLGALSVPLGPNLAADAKAAIPFTDQLYAAVKSAKSRPKSPVYAQISSAIYDNVYAVLSGQAKADDAIEKMVTQIQAAQDTF